MQKRKCRIVGNIAYVPLTQNQEAIIDVADVSLVEQYNWNAWWNKAAQAYYARTRQGKNVIYLHRFLLQCPKELEVDHKHRNPLDNRRSELRIVSHKQNTENRELPSKTGIRGVNLYVKGDTKYWRSNIRHNGVLSVKLFPFDDQGLVAAKQWVINMRQNNFTHSDGR
jgi:hypothetical protein